VLVGPETFDDAGVIDLGDGRALIHTVDFFPPIVDDPYQFGRVAAANALSDIYAMGGTPISALNIVAFPLKELGAEVLAEILAGGAAVVAQSGAALLGGHSVRDTEVKYGLAVAGVARTSDIRTNRAARCGDRLILTKPLGMGVISTGIKQRQVSAACVDAAVEIMATLNAGAASVAGEQSVHAVTDITGFGLMGHAAELAAGAGVTLRLFGQALPLAPGVADLAARGLTSGAARKNRASLGDGVSVGAEVSPVIASVAFDAETSGGLLLSVAADACDEVVATLNNQRTPCAAVVGEVVERQGRALVTLE
jgi:selenide, water dikinase